ncbi:MAG: methyltransferase [Xanthomonadaceae bacterium]|jgi:predicted methyltransferase|nr:methyltransferase [Xanthomonadaceae bacterium]
MKKIALAAAVTFALAACGKPAEQQAAAPAPAPAPAPAAEPAAPADPLAAFAAKMDTVLAGAHRSDANKARDAHRRPKETLQFFELKPGMTVVEITPGGGWYTEVLGPLMKGEGKLITAIVDPASASSDRAKEYYTQANADFLAKLAADAANFGEVEVREFALSAPVLGEPGSADMVVTFRNVHNWTGSGAAPGMFKGFFDVLKPGGVLGIEEHRATPGTPSAAEPRSGYMLEDDVIKLATDAGFVLAAKSEINANPKDTKDHPNGVWNLPPNLNVKEGDDKAKYEAIGESDRMTLRFIKPEAAAAPAAPAAEPAKQG